MVTSLLTATYMFRLVFLAFHGERRTARAAAHPEEEPAGARRTRTTPRRTTARARRGTSARRAAVDGDSADRAGDRIGRWPATSACRTRSAARNRIEAFLEPSFEAHEASRRRRPPWTPRPARCRPRAGAGRRTRRTRTATSTELMLMALSSGVALAGIGLAGVLLAAATAPPPTRWRAACRGVHRLLLNKYYVDEIYDAAIVQPIKLLSTGGLWKGVDAGVDRRHGQRRRRGGRGARAAALRRLQTGSVRDVRRVAVPRRRVDSRLVSLA